MSSKPPAKAPATASTSSATPSFLDNIIYDVVLNFWRFVINLFFREIRPRGAFNIPRSGPVLFVAAPHNNQFLDPLLLYSEVRREGKRRVAILTAAASMKRIVVGQAARAMQSIPVARAADNAKAGLGRVHLDPQDPTILIGDENSKFTEQCSPKFQILLTKGTGYASAQVLEVIDDHKLKVKGEFAVGGKDEGSSISATQRIKTEVGGSGQGGITYKVLPYVDQHDMYGAVYKRLMAGGCIGIFPEGGSHDRTDLLPLKAGVTIMALGALSTNPSLQLKIVPVGLAYFHPHKFRSRAVVEFGTPIDVPKELVDEFSRGGKEKREACGKLLDIIYDGLKTVTVRAPDYDTLMVIQAGRRLYKTPGQHLTLGQTVELNKRFIEGYMHYQHEAAVIELRKNIIAYNRTLRDLGLRDHQVERATRKSWRSLTILAYRSGLLLAWSILALPGVILHAPIFIPAKIISHKKAKEALAASTVKLAARDVIATWKVLFSLVATPALYLLYAIIATIIAYRYDAPRAVVWWMPVYVFGALPFMAMSALKFGEAAMDVFKSLRPLTLSIMPGNSRELEDLRKQRAKLSEELSSVINEFAPKLYQDFNDSRILPSSTAPPSQLDEGRRAGTEGKNILSHPLNWIDENLFGWSRAAKPSSYARSEGASTGASSPPADYEPPEFELDQSDYDQVIGIFQSHSGSGLTMPSSPGGRSRSYADLKRLNSESNLKTQTSPPVSPTAAKFDLPTDGLTHRNRKQSLNSSIGLHQLSQVASHADTFEEATEKCNEAKEKQLSDAAIIKGKPKFE